MYLPFRPIKGQAFRLYFSAPGLKTSGVSNWASNSRVPMPIFVEFSGITFRISKNGEGFTELTNAPVELTSGVGYIDLTQEEMNNDTIQIYGLKNAYSTMLTLGVTGCAITIEIYTQTSELTSAPTLISSLEDKITAIFQYFFNKRTITETSMTMYKEDSITPLATSTISDDTTVTKGKIT